MEQIYRRQSITSPPRSRVPAAEATSYKKTLLKQSAFCLLVLCGCLCIKTMQNPSLLPAQKTIQLVVDTTTDFRHLPAQMQAFFRSLLPESKDPTLEGKELLAHLTMPVKAPITSPFGLRNDPNSNQEAFHYGLDLGAPQGDKIKCAASGTVEEAGENAEYGKYIIIKHSDTISTLYAHCQELLPQAGDTVNAGQIIATVGATGNATGPHLHFEIRDGETWLDPAKFLDFSKKEPAND